MPNLEDINSKLQQVLQEQARMCEQLKGALRRIDEQKTLTESVHKLATSVELLASVQNSMEKKVDGLAKDVEEIKEKPAKRWDSAASVIITAIVTGVVTFLLTRIGLK